MQHLRSDYQGIQDVPALIAAGVLTYGPDCPPDTRAQLEALAPTSILADEPVFVLRGRDIATPAAVMMWVERSRLHGADPAMLDAVTAHAADIADWGRLNGAKVPDAPADALPALPAPPAALPVTRGNRDRAPAPVHAPPPLPPPPALPGPPAAASPTQPDGSQP